MSRKFRSKVPIERKANEDRKSLISADSDFNWLRLSRDYFRNVFDFYVNVLSLSCENQRLSFRSQALPK